MKENLSGANSRLPPDANWAAARNKEERTNETLVMVDNRRPRPQEIIPDLTTVRIAVEKKFGILILLSLFSLFFFFLLCPFSFRLRCDRQGSVGDSGTGSVPCGPRIPGMSGAASRGAYWSRGHSRLSPSRFARPSFRRGDGPRTDQSHGR